MSYHHIDFLIQSERRRAEVAIASQHRMVKEAQRAGMKLIPILKLKPLNFQPANQRHNHKRLSMGLAWLVTLFTSWS